MTVEELKQEKEKFEKEASKLYHKAREIEDQIRAMTSEDTKQYYGKYIKLDSNGYCRYIHINKADRSYDGWSLEGPGFTTYEYDEKHGRHFCEDLLHNFINMEDLNNARYVVTFLTKEEFFDDRKKYLEQLLNTTY